MFPEVSNTHVFGCDGRGGADLGEFLVTEQPDSLAGCGVVLTIFVMQLHRPSHTHQHPIAVFVSVELQEPCTVLFVNVTSAVFSHGHRVHEKPTKADSTKVPYLRRWL